LLIFSSTGPAAAAMRKLASRSLDSGVAVPAIPKWARAIASASAGVRIGALVPKAVSEMADSPSMPVVQWYYAASREQANVRRWRCPVRLDHRKAWKSHL
jgi:hypothetical protein